MSSSSPPDPSTTESKSTNSHEASPPSSSDSSWSSWFVSPSTLKDRFHEFDDQQRLDRLSECRKLEKILRGCRKRHSPGKVNSRYTKPKDTDDPIESISIGVRNMKYFGWRGILKPSSSSVSAPKDDAETTAPTSSNATPSDVPASEEPDTNLSVFAPQIRSSCAREEHALWACRAIATGCGKDLSELKKCFETVDHETSESTPNLPQHVKVLTSPYTNYQGIVDAVSENNNTLKQQIPCYEIQRTLGSCVTESGKQLLERKQRRDEQKQQQ